MKKIVIISAMILSFVNFSIAQESSSEVDNRKKMQFGIKAGLNYSNVYDKSGDGFSTNSKFGFVGGIFLNVPIGKYFGIQPSMLFSQNGFEGSGMMYGSTYSVTRTTNFLAIPLLASLKASEFFSIFAGPQYSYLIKQHNVFSSITTTAQQQQFENDDVRKSIFGVVLGVDINFKHITIGARVNWDIQDNNREPTPETPSYKNSWLQGTIGYKFYKK